MDKNRDGALTRYEFDTVGGPDAAQDDRLFREMDRNHDGVVSRSEWKGSGDVFDLLDRWRDGRLSLAEFQDDRLDGTLALLEERMSLLS